MIIFLFLGFIKLYLETFPQSQKTELTVKLTILPPKTLIEDWYEFLGPTKDERAMSNETLIPKHVFII